MKVNVCKEVDKRIQRPIEACEYISCLMEDCQDKTFNELIKADFTNPPNQVRSVICDFYYSCEKLFDVKAIYLEMNGKTKNKMKN